MPARGNKADGARTRSRKRATAARAKTGTLGDALTEARNQQAATSEILRVISRSRSDVQPVFDAIAVNALKLCDASSANVFTYDGTLVHLAALVNLTPAGADAIRSLWPRPPSRELAATRAILTRGVVEIPDVVLDTDFAPTVAAVAGNFRSILSVPLMREGSPIGAIAVGRPEAGAFPESHVALLRTFADQAVIAIENVRLFTALEARNGELTEALGRQTATSEILQVISQSRTDVQPVFDAIVRNAVRLCGADHSIAARFDGELLHPLAHHGFSPEAEEILARTFPMRPSPANMLGRTTLHRAVVNLPDMLADPDYSRDFALAGGWRSGLGVPLFLDGNLVGAIAVSRTEPGAFSDGHVELLKTFAEQAVIAIENVRLFNELESRNRDLSEALEQQMATGEILRAISQSPTDTQPVFDAIVRSASQLCDAHRTVLVRLSGDELQLAAVYHAKPRTQPAATFPRRLGRELAVGRAILDGTLVHIANVREDPEYSQDLARTLEVGSTLSVPLLRDGKPIGAIGVSRANPGPFPENRVRLLKTFADQAVIAIENVRLFTELEARNRDLTEALEQQTATSEILKVISRSQTDVQPVFDTIASAVLKLCRADFANVFTYDGNLIHLVASVNVHQDYVEFIKDFFPRPPGRETGSTRAIQTGKVEAIPDVLADPEYAIALPSASGGFRSILAVPLLRDGKALGAIAVGRPEPGLFPTSQVALLQTFADQAVIAIENVRLFRELKARTADLTRSVGELKALGEVGQAVSSTLNLETVLATIVSRATGLAGLDGGSIWEYDDARGEFQLHATNRLPDELVEVLRATPIRKGEGALGRLAVTGEPVEIPDIANERTYPTRLRELLTRYGYRSVLAVPLLRENQLLGALAVNRSSPGGFAVEVIDLLKTFATQSALAIQNARLFREIEQKSRELEAASRHKSEFLANMSHELRTPLNAIIGFSEVLTERMFGEINDKQAEYLRDILESGRHLLSLINDILDLSKIEAGRMELEPSEFDLAGAIENALILVRERANRHGIALVHEVDDRIGAIRADERKVKQVLLNLLTNALKFTPEGGRVEIRARVHNGAVEISVADTGVGIARDDQAAVFEEFRQVGTASKKVEGTGLGLAISRKFIELHGGRIWVTSEPGVGSTFAFTLPLSATMP